MKILCVIDNLNTGGAQRQIVNLARGLYKRGHSVSVFCYSPGKLLAAPLEEEEITIHLQLKKTRFSPDVILGLRKLIDQEKFHAVVSFLNTPNLYSIIASRLSKTKPSVVVSERFCDIPGNPTRVELAVRQTYRFSSKIVVNSHHQRKNFLRRYPWMNSRVITIYNGYDLEEFSPPRLEPMNAQPCILVVAGVSRYKNGLCVVRALDILRKDYGLMPKLNWAGKRVTVGESGIYLSQMEREINDLGLSQQWKWLDQRTDIPALLRQHDVLVHPSYGEGLPNAVCEAMSCGRPVIVSDALDHPNLVQNGINGFLFDWRVPAELARKINDFFSLSREVRNQMGKTGRDIAVKRLSNERYISEYERVLSELVK